MNKLITLSGPVSATVDSVMMSEELTEFELASIHFYSDSELLNKVAISSGSVDVKGTPDNVSYFSIDQGQFDAIDADSPNWQRPNAYGLMIRTRFTFSGIPAIATHFKALIWRK